MASQAIGIDIGVHAVKVAQLQKKGGMTRAVRLFRAPLEGDTDAVRIQGALKRAGITGGPGLVGITGRDLIVRYTHVPPVPDWRLKLLMQFEINEVSGQSGGEVAADYRKLSLPVEADEDTVLVALARDQYLHPRLAAATSAGIKAGGGCPNSVALFNAFLVHGSWEEGETTFLVNIGRDNIDMALQRDGELLFARNMAGGGQMFTEAIMSTFGLKQRKAEKNKTTKGDLTPRGRARYPDSTAEKLANAMQGPAGQLVSMIQSSVMIARAQTKISDLNVDKLVLTGGTARMKGIQPYFEQSMNVPVEVFDPAAEIDQSQLDPADAEELGEEPTDFTVAIGLAETLLQPQAFRLEVLTEKEKKRRHFTQRTIWAAAAGVVALVWIVLLFRSRGDAIETYQAANEQLSAVQKRSENIEDAQKTLLANERDARQKEVALRIRRLSGAFMREILAVVNDVHAAHAEFLFVGRVELECTQEHFSLARRPVKGAGADLGDAIRAQRVWPTLRLTGRIRREAPDPGGLHNAYTSQLIVRVDPDDKNEAEGRGLFIDGLGVTVNASAPDADNRFEVTFQLEKPAPKEND